MIFCGWELRMGGGGGEREGLKYTKHTKMLVF